MKPSPLKISKHVFLLGCDFFCVYLVKGQRGNVLIEGGPSFIAPLILSQLKDMEIAFESVKYLVILHSHPDHVMAIPYLKKYLPNVTLVGSKYSKTLLSEESIIEDFLKRDRSFCNIFSAPFIGFEAFGNIYVEKIVANGSYIDLGDVRLNFLESPGHTLCSLSVFLKDDELLIISDAAGFPLENNIIFPAYLLTFEEYFYTLEKLKNIDAKQLGIGHFGPFKGENVKLFFRSAMQNAYRMNNFIKTNKQRGMGEKYIENNLFNIYKSGITRYSKDIVKEYIKLIVKNSFECIDSH